MWRHSQNPGSWYRLTSGFTPAHSFIGNCHESAVLVTVRRFYVSRRDMMYGTNTWWLLIVVHLASVTCRNFWTMIYGPKACQLVEAVEIHSCICALRSWFMFILSSCKAFLGRTKQFKSVEKENKSSIKYESVCPQRRYKFSDGVTRSR